MPSNDIPNQYSLLGENTPMWLVLGLLLIGTIGSVTTVRLLLPSGLTMETLKSWVIPSNLKQRTSQPTLPIIRTIDKSTDMSTVTTPQYPKAEPIAKGSEGERESSLVSPDMAVEPMSPTSDEEIAEQPKVESDEPRAAEIIEGDRDSSPMPAASVATRAGTAVDLAEYKAIETTAQARTQLATDADKVHDCAPIFIVQFKYDGIQPIGLDLSEKATRLREWLSLHPEAKLQVEGHTDSYGPEDFNLLISHRRAKAVFELLARAGVTNKQMVTRAFGEYSPLAGFPPESERNRRVSLRVVGARACPKAESDGEIR